MRENNYSESKYQPGAEKLAIYEVKLRSWTRENPRKIQPIAW